MTAANPSRSPSKASPTLVRHKFPLLGTLFWLTGAVRLHKDADGFNAVWRGWHPVTWVVLVAMLIPCAFLGEALLKAVPLRPNSFWRINAEQLQWVTPFTRLDTLKPFNFAQARRRLAEADAAEEAEED